MKQKAAWDPEHHRIFVDVCVEQKLLGNKPGTQHVMEPFQQRVGAKFNKKQLKNHWDTMGKQWKIWRRLIQCPDMKWDPETNTFGATDEDWANYLQVNPDAGQYRLSPPMYLKKLEVIFEGSIIEADEAGSSCKRRRRITSGEEEEEEEADNTGDDDRQSLSNSQSKGYWPPSAHELFIDLLVQETYKGNRPDTHYPKESWKMMLDVINQTTGRNYTRPQLKNHWDCTRKAWKIWCQVVGASIMKWDPITRTFGATDEDWRIYLQENPRAAQFRRKHILHADKLATIFEGVIEPGKAYFRSYRKRPRDNSESPPRLHYPTPLSTLYLNEPVMGSEDGDDADDEDDDADNDIDMEEPSPLRRRFNGVGFGESRLQDVEIVTPPVCHRFNAERLRESPRPVIPEQYEYSIGECIECLDGMEEVEEGCDLYLFALDLFLKKEYREIFLQLKKSSLRMSWLLRLQSAGTIITAD